MDLPKPDLDDLRDVGDDVTPGSSQANTPLACSRPEDDDDEGSTVDEEEEAEAADNAEEGDTVLDEASEDSLAQIAQVSGELATPGGPNHRKYADEEPDDPAWKKHKKHVFIFSNAGKPIYSRYGDENSLAGFCGVLQALISFVEGNDDTIRAVIAGDHTFVFVQKGVINLACVSRTGEPASQLAQQLNYMYSQILSILTGGVLKIFEKRAQFDLRSLLGGSERFLDRLMSWMDHDYSLTLNSIHCLRLNVQHRNLIGSILHSCRTSNLLYAILIARHQLVNLLRPRKHLLHPSDLHLVLNFVNTCTAFRTSETWTPICLPRFNDKGFLHAYVCYIATDICLVLISPKVEDFYQLSECRNSIVQRFKSGGENNIFAVLEHALKEQFHSVGDIGAPGLLHFVYKSLGTSQIICPKMEPPYVGRKEQKRLFRVYQYVHKRASQSSNKVFMHSTGKELVLAWMTGGFKLYATFGPLVALPSAIRGCNTLLSWIKQEENSIFVLDSPVFG